MVKKTNTASKTKADKKREGTPADTSSGAPSSDWPPVDMGFLAPTTAPAPAFPLSELPATFGALISGLADARQVPLDYVAGTVFGACSGAIGNRARLRKFDGDSEPGILFVGLVGKSSSGKSAALKIGQQLLEQIDRDLATAHASLSWGTAQSTLAKLDQRLAGAVRCAWGPRDGMKRVRECVHGAELDLRTLVWTREGRFPVDFRQGELVRLAA